MGQSVRHRVGGRQNLPIGARQPLPFTAESCRNHRIREPFPWHASRIPWPPQGVPHDRPTGSRSSIRRWLAALGLLAALLLPAAGHAQSRIKDIADFEGIRDNMLVGYGLVVGLNGTGDSLQNSVFTKESLVGMLDRLGVNARDTSLRTKNIAAVMVTATLPPFARQGTRVDIVVSTLGDAANLMGGTLLVTPLVGADAGSTPLPRARSRFPASPLRAPALQSPAASPPPAASPTAPSSSARSPSSWPLSI